MRLKRAVVAVIILWGSAACGGDDTATPEPTGTHEITGRIMGPADDARNTVDRLNDRQEQTENSYP